MAAGEAAPVDVVVGPNGAEDDDEVVVLGGTSNAFFMIGDEIITAPLGGSILPGVTRDSTITLLRKWGYKVSDSPSTRFRQTNALAKGAVRTVRPRSKSPQICTIQPISSATTPVRMP